jgi:hypothetical protein
MNIDPRVMKELLQLQLLNSSSLISGDSSSTDESGMDFNSMLQNLMGQTGQASTNDNLLSGGLTGLTGFTGLVGMQSPSLLSPLNRSYTPHQSIGNDDASSQYDSLIDQASSKYGVDPSLVKAVIDQESSFNNRAVSSAGAKGLMQLMDDTGSGLGVTNPFDPQQNVHAGTKFLADLLHKYNGNEGTALAAYNAGPGRVDRLGIRNDSDLSQKLHQLPQETQAYVSKVIGLKGTYE